MNKFTRFFFTFLLFFSCKEQEFLTEIPHTISDASFYTNPEGALQGLNAAYDILQLGLQVERIEFCGTVCSGDAIPGGEPGGNDSPAIMPIFRFQINSDYRYMESYWRAMYRGIYRCNLILSHLQGPIHDFPDELRLRIRGEALFLRGLFHFKLQVTFGGFPQLQGSFIGQLKGVPFVDHLLSVEEWKQKRPDLNYTWERIEQDFTEATKLLPLRSALYNNPENIGRATRGAALAMLAKTCLYQEKWLQAYDAAKTVIESGEYYLEGETGHDDPYIITRLTKEGEVSIRVPGYKWIWQPEANNCAESVFEVQHYQSNSTVFPEGQEGNLVPQYYGPRAVLIYQFNPESGKDTLVPKEIFWGFILPTRYFVTTAYRDVGCTDETGNILDPRFKLSVITPEDSVPYYYRDPMYRAKYPDSVKIDPFYNYPATGNSTWKYFTDPYYSVKRGSLGDMPQNTKYFRFADLLLIGAEAAVYSGHEADALVWINRVRDRAMNAGNTGYPLPLSSVSAEQIWAERRVELCFEGHQFHDIIRTGRAEKVIKTDAMQYEITITPVQYTWEGEVYNLILKEQYGEWFDIGKDEIWPVPASEIEFTSGMLEQNPNW
jgi:hypothetical protein